LYSTIICQTRLHFRKKLFCLKFIEKCSWWNNKCCINPFLGYQQNTWWCEKTCKAISTKINNENHRSNFSRSTANRKKNPQWVNQWNEDQGWLLSDWLLYLNINDNIKYKSLFTNQWKKLEDDSVHEFDWNNINKDGEHSSFYLIIPSLKLE